MALKTRNLLTHEIFLNFKKFSCNYDQSGGKELMDDIIKIDLDDFVEKENIIHILNSTLKNKKGFYTSNCEYLPGLLISVYYFWSMSGRMSCVPKLFEDFFRLSFVFILKTI